MTIPTTIHTLAELQKTIAAACEDYQTAIYDASMADFAKVADECDGFPPNFYGCPPWEVFVPKSFRAIWNDLPESVRCHGARRTGHVRAR